MRAKIVRRDKKQTKKKRGIERTAVGQIHFGPPEEEWPPEVKKEFQDAHRAVRHLVGQIYNGPHKKELIDRLIDLGLTISSRLETLWKDPDYRPLVEASSRQRNFFPLVHTNLIETPFSCGDKMREGLPLQPAPGNEKGKKGGGKPGRKVLNDLLNSEVEMFVHGVLQPNWLRMEYPPAEQNKSSAMVPLIECVKVDLIDRATRQHLLSPIGRKSLSKWSQAFVEKYIHPHRPDLLSKNGETGKFHGMVAERLSDLQAKNPNEKSPWRALKALVDERLRKFKRLIEAQF
jgi:hypothetical protein